MGDCGARDSFALPIGYVLRRGGAGCGGVGHEQGEGEWLKSCVSELARGRADWVGLVGVTPHAAAAAAAAASASPDHTTASSVA